jgi:hypothetical protein
MKPDGRKILFRVEWHLARTFADSLFDDHIGEAIGLQRDPRSPFSTPRILEAWQIIAALREGRTPAWVQ